MKVMIDTNIFISAALTPNLVRRLCRRDHDPVLPVSLHRSGHPAAGRREAETPGKKVKKSAQAKPVLSVSLAFPVHQFRASPYLSYRASSLLPIIPVVREIPKAFTAVRIGSFRMEQVVVQADVLPAEEGVRGPAGLLAVGVVVVVAAENPGNGNAGFLAVFIVEILAGDDAVHAVAGGFSVGIEEVPAAENARNGITDHLSVLIVEVFPAEKGRECC